MIVTALILLGFAASTYGTIIGAGGGFLFVPVLLMFYDISPDTAAATGLAIVFLNAAAGLPVLLKQRRILLRTGWLVALGAFPGTFLGIWLVSHSPIALYYVLFACLLVGLGVFLIMKQRSSANTEVASTMETTANSSSTNADQIKTMTLLYLGCLLGVISSYFGVGGGWLLVPILAYGFGLSLKTATATSIFSLALYSLVGLIPSLAGGSVNWHVVMWSGIGVILGAQAGAILSAKIKGTVITRLLAFVVILMGVQLIFQIK